MKGLSAEKWKGRGLAKNGGIMEVVSLYVDSLPKTMTKRWLWAVVQFQRKGCRCICVVQMEKEYGESLWFCSILSHTESNEGHQEPKWDWDTWVQALSSIGSLRYISMQGGSLVLFKSLILIKILIFMWSLDIKIYSSKIY